ncbi:Prohibitin [Tupaia chinensis]|uniref:Prohibitin n=1 Tax=Tupaia chinensis TaxID=246437 RepID=L9KI32_TUPCH|nr:Prohibitin [Tupaia chinensis]
MCQSSLVADLQNVNLFLRTLFHPMASQLPCGFTSMGEDYDERVLRWVPTEILVALFKAGELVTQRELVSSRMHGILSSGR